jgi:hypothetical protein
MGSPYHPTGSWLNKSNKKSPRQLAVGHMIPSRAEPSIQLCNVLSLHSLVTRQVMLGIIAWFEPPTLCKIKNYEREPQAKSSSYSKIVQMLICVNIIYNSKWTINNLHGSISTQFNYIDYDYDSIFWRNSVSTVKSSYIRGPNQPCCVQQRVPSKVGLIKSAKIEGHTQVESTALLILLEIDHPFFPLSIWRRG